MGLRLLRNLDIRHVFYPHTSVPSAVNYSVVFFLFLAQSAFISPDDVFRSAEELYREGIGGGLEPMPGVVELLRGLQQRGRGMAIVSSTPRANIELILGSLGLAGAFAVVVAAEDARRGKPHPEGFLAAAERLGVAPADCVVLEDAPEGIEGAKAAGMRCIGVATTRPPQRLSAADLVVGRLDDPRAEAFLLGHWT